MKSGNTAENRKFFCIVQFLCSQKRICVQISERFFSGSEWIHSKPEQIHFITSRNATDLTPLSVCSDPRQEETPQWKCAPTRLKVAASGPPDIVAPTGVRNSISRVRPLFTSLVLELVIAGVVIFPLISLSQLPNKVFSWKHANKVIIKCS